MSVSLDAPTVSARPAPLASTGELTFRALASGCVLGALLSAGNVYASLKTGYIDGGSISAAVIGFAVFSASRRRYSPLENNLTQTVASSAAMTAAGTGVLAALALSGRTYPTWTMVLWLFAMSVLGVAIARWLRRPLLVEQKLQFPTGAATGEIIESMHSVRATGLRRARTLLYALLMAGLVTWFRDAQPHLPQSLNVPGGPVALGAAGLWLGVSVSPVMFGTGMIVGPRGGASVLLGSVLAWCVLAPLLLALKWAPSADYQSLNAWLLWPGVALLLAGALTSLALDWRSAVRAISDLSFWRRSAQDRTRGEREPVWTWIVLGAVLVCVAVGERVFDVHPLRTLLTLAFAIVMAIVCARAAGETDVAPGGAASTLTQLLFGAPSAATSLASAGVVYGTVAQTAQTLWALRAGQRLNASPRVQLFAQLLGLGVGALVAVPVYDLVARGYGVGTATMPAPGALSWKATADAVQLGAAAMPPSSLLAALVAFAVGVALTLLARSRHARYLPSPVALGIAFLLPPGLSGALFVGAMVLAVLSRARPAWTREYATTLAAGAIAGESLVGVGIAALLATGAL